MDDCLYKLINFKDFICNLFKKNKLTYESFKSNRNIETTKIIHFEILNYIKENFSVQEIKIISTYFKQLTEEPAFLYGSQEEKELALAVISSYLKTEEFFTKYYIVKNNQLIFKNICIPYGEENVPQIKKCLTSNKSIFRNKRSNYIPMVITESGNIFCSQAFHRNLIKWLIHSGEDLTNAINLRVYYSNNGYITMESTDVQKNIGISNERKSYVSLLTEKQIAQIINIYMLCIETNKNFADLESCFAGHSTYGLGFDFLTYGATKFNSGQKVNITEQNLRTLSLFRKYISMDEVVGKIKNNKQTNQWV